MSIKRDCPVLSTKSVILSAVQFTEKLKEFPGRAVKLNNPFEEIKEVRQLWWVPYRKYKKHANKNSAASAKQLQSVCLLYTSDAADE